MNNPPHLVEIFSSIQGEGPYVGVRQIFVRFFGCDVRCLYCDTPHEVPPAQCAVELPGGKNVHVPNPVGPGELLAVLRGWTSPFPGLHHSVSITGGEPLLHAAALREILPDVRKILPVYLETSGLHVQELEAVVDHLDYVSMDIKLPSAAGIAPQWEKHRQFLAIAHKTEVYVKMVVAEETSEEELLLGAHVVADVDPEIVVVLQPRTSSAGTIGVSGTKLLRLQEAAARVVRDVRVIPQTHRFLNVL